ncbi:MAG TPA: hypothetical protein ENL09_02295 [Bacteroidetes bacterium]|nr:hypothetical protein [Bacteroidota bacterium]
MRKDFEKQKNPLLCSLVQQKSGFSSIDEVLEENRNELAQIVHGALIENYDEEIHVGNIIKDQTQKYLTNSYSEEDLKYIYLGVINFHPPRELLMHISREQSISFFYGVGKFLHEEGNPKYYFTPFAHASGYSAIDIINHFIKIWNENKGSPVNLVGKERRYPRRSVNNPLHNENITYEQIKDYMRKDMIINDIKKFMETNWRPLYKGPEETRSSHTRIQQNLISQLKQEGQKTYTEVEIRTVKKLLTAIDVVSLNNGNMTLYDCKSNTGLDTHFYRTEDSLKTASSFFFYNFGYLPFLKIKKRFPPEPINIPRPKVNLRYAGIFNQS